MVLEKVAGPFSGYYVAAYAASVEDSAGEYIGYFKICSIPPVNYFEAECLLKNCCPSPAPAPDDAIAAAQMEAKRQIAALPQVHDLKAHADKRPFNFFELQCVASMVRET